MTSSVGAQRANRQTHHRRAQRRRYLSVLGAAFVLALAFGAPAVAATSSRVTTHDNDPSTGHGNAGGPPGVGDPHGRGQALLTCLEALLRELRAREVSGSQSTGSPTPPTRNPAPPATPPTTVPITTPPPTPPTAAPPAGPTVAIATATPLATRAATTLPVRRAASRAATPAGPQSASPPAGGVPVHPPQSRGGQVTRALRTARSYGLLLILAGAVLAFLAVQSRVDRRDPRIARAPIDAHRDFRDFE